MIPCSFRYSNDKKKCQKTSDWKEDFHNYPEENKWKILNARLEYGFQYVGTL